MFQIALYGPGQHDQRRWPGDRPLVWQVTEELRLVFAPGEPADPAEAERAVVRIEFLGEPIRHAFAAEEIGEVRVAADVGRLLEIFGTAPSRSIDPYGVVSHGPLDSEQITLPTDECTLLRIGEHWLEVQPIDAPPLDPMACGYRVLPGHGRFGQVRAPDFHVLGRPPSSETLSRWFAALGQLQRWTAGSNEFYQRVAQAVCDPGGVDAGLVLLGRPGAWQIVGSHVPCPPWGISYWSTLADRVASDGHTWYRLNGTGTRRAAGVRGEADASWVMAPIVGEDGTTMGIVAGLRGYGARNRRRGIRPLEALWLQLVAGAVSSAMARLHHETEAARSRVLLEQAFTPHLVDQLQRRPELLEGQTRDISLLFVDLRDSSALAQQLPPERLDCLLGELMDLLSDQVLDRGGVVIDYYGDGLAAMWNAPADQPDHALQACEAAWGMHRQVGQLAERWRALVPHGLRLAIGIHSGTAHVGNAGSRRRIKYGPRGTAVHVASRLEERCKKLGLDTVLSDTVRQRLPADTPLRCLGIFRLRGISEAVTLYQLCGRPASRTPADALERLEACESALVRLEQEDVLGAMELLEPGAAPAEVIEVAEEGVVAGKNAGLQQRKAVRQNEMAERNEADQQHELAACSTRPPSPAVPPRTQRSRNASS